MGEISPGKPGAIWCDARLGWRWEFQAEDFVGHLVEVVIFELVGVDAPEPVAFYCVFGLDP